jgi:histone H3/H4
MYGYGLEGYGYRYPPIEEYYQEPIVLGTVSRGPRKGMTIKRYPPKVNKTWVAAYLLNKQIAQKNKWREYATKALQAASDEYFNKEILPLRDKNPEAFARAILNIKRRKAKKDKLPLALRTEEGKKLYEELLQFEKDNAKLREIYYGKEKKERKRKPLPKEEIERIIKEYEALQLQEPLAKK